jgi:DNA-binding beta-propeller fold protein YncE
MRVSSGGRARDLARMLAIFCLAPVPALAAGAAPTFTMNSHYFTPPGDRAVPGDSHGDIAVSPAGEIYASVQGGNFAGIQVYAANGKYLRNVPNAPADLHGFIIAKGPGGRDSIFGVSRLNQKIIEMSLDGKMLLSIQADKVIPDRFKEHAPGKPATNLTGIAVAPNGDIYVTDGYGLSFIHRFDKDGHYLTSFGGAGAPWNFDQAHKIAIDTRFSPVRLLCTDRRHRRLVAMDLDGKVLQVFGEGLRLPSAFSVHGNELAVAELEGRVTILGPKNEVIATLGQNDNPSEVHVNSTPPSVWKEGLFYEPHGVAYDAAGNLLVTEFNQYGRLTRATRD